MPFGDVVATAAQGALIMPALGLLPPLVVRAAASWLQRPQDPCNAPALCRPPTSPAPCWPSHRTLAAPAAACMTPSPPSLLQDKSAAGSG